MLTENCCAKNMCLSSEDNPGAAAKISFGKFYSAVQSTKLQAKKRAYLDCFISFITAS